MTFNNQYKKYTYTTTICQYICPMCGLTIFRKKTALVHLRQQQFAYLDDTAHTILAFSSNRSESETETLR